jgi:hypothetical protein
LKCVLSVFKCPPDFGGHALVSKVSLSIRFVLHGTMGCLLPEFNVFTKNINLIIHFERSPPDGECYRRAIEVEGQKWVPLEREQRGGAEEGSSRKL